MARNNAVNKTTNNNPNDRNVLDSTRSLLVEKKKVGEFVFDHQVGSGSLGPVWRGHRCDTDELVAIKAISRNKVSQSRNISSEVAILKTLQHPNLVTFLDLKVRELSVIILWQ